MLACNPGYADCNGFVGDGCEVHVLSDNNNCGACGNVCPSGTTCLNGACAPIGAECVPGATQSCYTGPAGTMGIGICTAGVQVCQANGTWGPCTGEVTPQAETCNNLDDDCDGVVDNGFDKQHDPNNCGTCGHVCGPYANATAICSAGNCALVCNFGFADCNGFVGDGCEVSVLFNNDNCGACGNVCSGGTTCQNGACV
jgi:hypothetical protein